MEVAVAKLRYYSVICPEGLRKPCKFSDRTVDVPLKIRTERLPNMSLRVLQLHQPVRCHLNGLYKASGTCTSDSLAS
jgi:hypothetical protein